MMKSMKSMLMGGAILLGLAMCLTSCEGTLDDVFGEWSRPTGNNGNTTTTVAVKSVTLDETTLRKAVGDDAVTLTATVDPSDASDKTLTWESSDETVATVDASGKITPKKAGTVTITATTTDGGKKATSTVYIYDKIVDISTDISVDAGESWLINGTGTTEAKSITIANHSKVTLNGINITKGINCTDNATIILADGSTNTVANTGSYLPGIKIGTGTTTTLTIDAETEGTGTLTVQGGNESAGIGTACVQNSETTGGNIVINGGTVKATGGEKAAGIGTGCSEFTVYSTSNTCGAITIGAGVKSVTATKGTGSPNSIGKGASEHGGGQTCGTIKFGTLDVFNGSAWTTTMTDGNTYGGLKLAISGDTWTLTPVAP